MRVGLISPAEKGAIGATLRFSSLEQHPSGEGAAIFDFGLLEIRYRGFGLRDLGRDRRLKICAERIVVRIVPLFLHRQEAVSEILNFVGKFADCIGLLASSFRNPMLKRAINLPPRFLASIGTRAAHERICPTLRETMKQRVIRCAY